NPFAQWDNESRILGNGNKLSRRDQASLWMVPAQKRLKRTDLVVFETDNGLIEQLEFVVGERALQVLLQLAAGLHARIHFRRIKTIDAASVVLGFIKSD